MSLLPWLPWWWRVCIPGSKQRTDTRWLLCSVRHTSHILSPEMTANRKYRWSAEHSQVQSEVPWWSKTRQEDKKPFFLQTSLFPANKITQKNSDAFLSSIFVLQSSPYCLWPLARLLLIGQHPAMLHWQRQVWNPGGCLHEERRFWRRAPERTGYCNA